MTRSVAFKSQLPLLVGALALAAGCTFEPPGSVLNNQVGPSVDGGAGGGADADTGVESTESLTFTFTSSPVGQVLDYAPANVVATWIEDSAGAYVATIDRQAATRVNHLVAWRAASGPNNLDAVTGATRLNHAQPVVVNWDIPASLPNGIYTIRVETCDANSNTADQNNQGTFTFDKNGTAALTTGLDGNGYTGITIDYKVAAP